MPMSGYKFWSWVLPLAVFLLLIPVLVQNTYYLHLVNLILVYSIVTMGLHVITGLTGQVSLGHAAFLGIGAYAAAIFTTKVGLPFEIAVLAAILVTALAGWFVAVFTLHLEGPYLAMATIGIGEITRQILINWASVTGGPSGIVGIPSIRLGPWSIQTEQEFFYFILVVAVLICLLCFRVERSRIGRALIAIREREGAAKAVGIDTPRLKTIAFVFSTTLAGLAGAIYAHWVNYISPDSFAFSESLLFLTMIMIGGTGSLTGAILGTGALVMLSELLRDFEQLRMIVYSLLIFAVLLFFREGLIGMVPKKLRTVRYEDPGKADATSNLIGSRAAQGEFVITTKKLSKHFGGLKALNEVDFQLRPKQIHAIIGPNGSGKSTFLNCLAGWYEADGGSLVYCGTDVTKMPIHKRATAGIARTFQNILLFKSMTVLENVLVALQGKGKNEQELIAEAYGILRFVGLTDLANEPAASIPYGEQRRVEIARALALKPTVLLLDEPAAGMNDKETEDLMQLICRIRDAGITVVVVEHDMKLVMGIADRITVFNQGQILAEGTPQEIRNNPDVIEAYLGREAEHAIG